jgi:hypothetical protein
MKGTFFKISSCILGMPDAKKTTAKSATPPKKPALMPLWQG